jgi:hypothetical protein
MSTALTKVTNTSIIIMSTVYTILDYEYTNTYTILESVGCVNETTKAMGVRMI